MKFKIIAAITILLVILFTLTSCSSENVSFSPQTVKTEKAEKHRINTAIYIKGILVPVRTASVSTKISGIADKINVDTGNTVKVGETLISLDKNELTAKLNQQEAQLESAKASLQAKKDQADKEKISLNLIEKNYNRMKELLDSNAVSQSDFDDIQTKYDLEKKECEIESGSALNIAKASVNTAQTAVSSAQIDLKNTNIVSQVSGVVTNRNINQGELAVPGTQLIVIADTSKLKLKGTVPQEIVPLLHTGQNIDVSIDILNNKKLKGQISQLGPIAVSTGEYFPIEITINNSNNIKPGCSAHALMNIKTEAGIVIPKSAIINEKGQNYLYVIKNDIALKRVVTLGPENDREVMVLQGLSEGEQVAVSDTENLLNNMSVKVVKSFNTK